MTKNRMFPFITRTWNPIAGGYVEEDGEQSACRYLCSYCWARRMINMFGRDNLSKKYSGPYRCADHAMKTKFKLDDFVATQLMGDIGHPMIPWPVIIKVFDRIKEFPDTDFLLLTKNPYWYIVYQEHLPENVYLGATIETNLDHTLAVSQAPSTQHRLNVMEALKVSYPDRPRFISVEPIMKFDYHFLDLIIRVAPWGVAVGYDNYDNGLKEPTLEETEALIDYLEEAGITVYRKTIREAEG